MATRLLLLFLWVGCGEPMGSDAGIDASEDAGVVDGGAPSDAGVDAARTDAGTVDAGTPEWVYTSETRTIDSSGETRTLLLARPEPMPGGALPLVIALHGDGGRGAGIRSSLALELEATSGAVFVYPDSVADAFEYWTDAGRAREAQLVRDLVASLEAELGIDPARVFLAGFSGGATMANAVGCRLGRDVVRGLGIHSGTLYPVDGDFGYTGSGGVDCALPAALFVWGTDDMTGGVTFADGSGVRDNYVATQSCAGSTSAWTLEPCVAYDACDAAVVWCPIEGMGHSVWAEAGRAMWAFFDAQR